MTKRANPFRTIPFANLRPGDQFRPPSGQGVLVTVLRAPEIGHEPWGSENQRVWARNEDNGREGYVTYGLSATVELENVS